MDCRRFPRPELRPRSHPHRRSRRPVRRSRPTLLVRSSPPIPLARIPRNRSVRRSRHLQRRSRHLQRRSRHLQRRSRHLQRRSRHLQRRSCHLQRRSRHLQRRSRHLQRRSRHLQRRSCHLQRRSCHPYRRLRRPVRRSLPSLPTRSCPRSLLVQPYLRSRFVRPRHRGRHCPRPCPLYLPPQQRHRVRRYRPRHLPPQRTQRRAPRSKHTREPQNLVDAGRSCISSVDSGQRYCRPIIGYRGGLGVNVSVAARRESNIASAPPNGGCLPLASEMWRALVGGLAAAIVLFLVALSRAKVRSATGLPAESGQPQDAKSGSFAAPMA